MPTLALEMTLEVVTCCVCGAPFGMPQALHRTAKQDPQTWFYCPVGHQQHFSKSDADRLREEKQRLERQLANREEDLRSERAAHSVTKGQLTKTRRRIANGVCPCCQRTFANVARHISAKHPEFAPETRA